MDAHCELILEEYRENINNYDNFKAVLLSLLRKMIEQNSFYVENIEARVKTEQSLTGKLELKGEKYSSLKNITDIVGARIVTFYSDDVDKIAAIVEKTFEIDWKNSIDKRKLYDPNRFGYMSNHYICRVPKELYYDNSHPEINEIWFELQLRTALQHVWATINHELGYKTSTEVPYDFLRSLSRLSSLLELADEEFFQIRVNLENYRKDVLDLISSGKFDKVKLDKDSFNYYLLTNPFRELNEKIAKINNAEICVSREDGYCRVLKKLGFSTLQDVENMKEKYSQKAYELANIQMKDTDLDIFSSSLAIKNLCIVYVYEKGGGEKELTDLLDYLHGEKSSNNILAKRLIKQMQELK